MSGISFSDPPGIVAGKGHLSQMAEVEIGPGRRLLLISGQVAWDEAGGVVGAGDFAAQFRHVYANVQRALESRGGTWADVAGFRTYLTDAADIPEFHRLRELHYPELFPSGRYPTNTLLVIDRLAEPELLLEVEAMAVVGS